MNETITIYNNYTIHTSEGTEKGIFFRNPIQEVRYDSYYFDAQFNPYDYISKIKNPLRRLYERILCNGCIIDHIEEWIDQNDWAGFHANILCCPIYFKRKYRKLEAISTSKDDNIQSIMSYGYESEWNDCAGDCALEKTVVTMKNGRKIKIKKKDQFYYTYRHIVKEILKK